MVRNDEQTREEETDRQGRACLSESGMRLPRDSEPESARAGRVRQPQQVRTITRLLLLGLQEEGDVALGDADV